LYYRLIREFANITGVPMLLNTSFNENEPIVDTPAQAVACFLRTQMDAIVIGNTIVTRNTPPQLRRGGAEHRGGVDQQILFTPQCAQSPPSPRPLAGRQPPNPSFWPSATA